MRRHRISSSTPKVSTQRLVYSSFELNSQSIFHQTTSNGVSQYVSSSSFCSYIQFSTSKCDDEEDNLLQEINSYRATLNLTALTKNDKAECLADEMADQFKNQPCTNNTGSNTIPGTEPRFSDFPRLLSKCHLNVTVTRDGQILPACVPGLVPGLIVSNFTKSQYSGYLNDAKYTGVGIGSENDWIIVVLTTSTAEGSFTPDNNSANLVSKFGAISHAFLLFVIFFVLR